MTMSKRLSMVGGTVSFVAVAVLSALSLDMVEGEGFFMQGLFPFEACTPAVEADSQNVEGDSIRTPSAENQRR